MADRAGEGDDGAPPGVDFRQATDATAQPQRLRLDELLDELVVRAGEVRATQGRLRGLLDAVIFIAQPTSLPSVLHRAVQAACELVDARYGALGVINPSGQGLSDFLTVGLSDEEYDAIGDLPKGLGLLGALIRDPRPIRLSRLSDDSRSVGFPPHHPAMTSFLGVPLRVGHRVYGNLYLTDKRGAAEFSDEDEQLVVALASAAGLMVQNAQLREADHRQQRWAAASAAVAAITLRGVSEADLLHTIAGEARAAAAADSCAILLPFDAESLAVAACDGPGGEDVAGRLIPLGDSMAGRVMATCEAVAVDNLTGDPPTWRLADDSHRLAAAAFAPLTGEGNQVTPAGVLAVAYERGRAWEAEELAPMVAFARQAAIALRLSRAQRERSRLAVLEDRERIARDLHDLVIQRLFATGMTLQSTLRLVDRPDVQQRLVTAMNELDATIREVRQAIFQINAEERPAGLRANIQEIVDEVTGPTDLVTRVQPSGVLNSLPTGAVTDHLLAALREAVTNVVRHSRASTVEVRIAVDDQLVLEVLDDGVGVDPTVRRRSGLANLASRAAELGGSCELLARPGGGTCLRWVVPLSA
jgi:signal transduction histidine kinase